KPSSAPAPQPKHALPATGIGSLLGLALAALGVAAMLAAWLRRRPM
ncbi:MAG: LPXTG cell wall anchor domain-containing protein, partial [Actinomycetota bacterium]